MESVIFIELYKRSLTTHTTDLYYWKDRTGAEVDFLLFEKGVKELIQVTWDIGAEDTKKREIRGLLRAMEAFGLKSGKVITYDREDEEGIGGRRIVFYPLWRFLLDIQ